MGFFGNGIKLLIEMGPLPFTDGLIPKESVERIGYKTEPYFHLTKCKGLEVK